MISRARCCGLARSVSDGVGWRALVGRSNSPGKGYCHRPEQAANGRETHLVVCSVLLLVWDRRLRQALVTASPYKSSPAWVVPQPGAECGRKECRQAGPRPRASFDNFTTPIRARHLHKEGTAARGEWGQGSGNLCRTRQALSRPDRIFEDPIVQRPWRRWASRASRSLSCFLRPGAVCLRGAAARMRSLPGFSSGRGA